MKYKINGKQRDFIVLNSFGILSLTSYVLHTRI